MINEKPSLVHGKLMKKYTILHQIVLRPSFPQTTLNRAFLTLIRVPLSLSSVSSLFSHAISLFLCSSLSSQDLCLLNPSLFSQALSLLLLYLSQVFFFFFVLFLFLFFVFSQINTRFDTKSAIDEVVKAILGILSDLGQNLIWVMG
jgi:hypothetical protein